MIENHVVNIELSKRLKELGFNKPSLFAWLYDRKNDEYESWYLPGDDGGLSEKECKAYVATELLEWLPKFIEDESEDCYLSISNDSKQYWVGYWCGERQSDHIDIEQMNDDSLSNALAKMMIYLVENGFMEVKK